MNIDERLIEARQAINKAQAALRSGDKRAARAWAERAATLAPELEEPWLLLAAVSPEPRKAIEHLQRALRINPASQRARAGMQAMRKKLQASQAGTQPVQVPLSETQPVRIKHNVKRPVPAARPARKSRRGLWVMSLLVIAVLMVSGLAYASPALAAFGNGFSQPAAQATEGNSWGEVQLVKPTYTATITPSPTPTFTPSPTPTFTATPMPPTFTPVPVYTSTPVESAVDIVPTSVPATQTPTQPAYSGYKYILVDISEQHLYAYENDVLVYSFVASTGMNNATRAGMFSILNKIDNAYGSTWDIWMPNWMGIYWAGSLQNGIHALPIMSNGVRLWAGYLGTPISYGCVVLGVNEAQLLYDWAEIGTPVEIRW